MLAQQTLQNTLLSLSPLPICIATDKINETGKSKNLARHLRVDNPCISLRDRVDNKKPLPTLMHRLTTLRWKAVRRQSIALTRSACLINFDKRSCKPPLRGNLQTII
jgi:hypothetical protein